MSNTWMVNACHKLFMLILLLLVVPLFLGLDAIADASWLAGASVDVGDDLCAEPFPILHVVLAPQGLVVSQPLALLTVLFSIPFHPPV